MYRLMFAALAALVLVIGCKDDAQGCDGGGTVFSVVQPQVQYFAQPQVQYYAAPIVQQQVVRSYAVAPLFQRQVVRQRAVVQRQVVRQRVAVPRQRVIVRQRALVY